MRLAALTLLAGSLAACGSADGDQEELSAPPTGEIQALANAEAMLNTREDLSANEEPQSEAEPEEAR